MKAKLSGFLGVLSLPLALLTLAPGEAAAQSCNSTYSQAFSRLRSFVPRATDQGRSDAEVRALFGPRPAQCEAGAYTAFLDSLVNYSREALRIPKRDRDNYLRLAISAAQQGPMKVPYAEGKRAVADWRQARSDLSSIVEDVAIKDPSVNLLGNQIIATLAAGGPPSPGTAPSSPEPVEVPSTPPSTPPVVQTPPSTPITRTDEPTKIKVPQKPMPGWAIIKIYQMRDSIKSQDMGALQIRLQDIINWIEQNPPE